MKKQKKSVLKQNVSNIENCVNQNTEKQIVNLKKSSRNNINSISNNNNYNVQNNNKSNQNLLYLAIQFMNNDLIEYELTATRECAASM